MVACGCSQSISVSAVLGRSPHGVVNLHNSQQFVVLLNRHVLSRHVPQNLVEQGFCAVRMRAVVDAIHQPLLLAS